MAYEGQVQSIFFGQGGLQTDDPDTQVPAANLVRALNVTYEGNRLSKAPGAIRYNKVALSSGILGALDWWPSDILQRTIAVTSDGSVWRLINQIEQGLVLNPTNASQNTLQVNNSVMLVEGGGEVAMANRKIFIFTGNNPVQVISGDATTRTNIALAALDWLNPDSTPGPNQPTAGVIHNNRLWTWGNRNNPHTLYASNPEDHEDFQTLNVATFWPVYPGEHQAILACYVFKNRLFIFKYPFGIYYLDDSDPSIQNWAVRKYLNNFGAASSHGGTEVLNDFWFANSFGTITSATAVLNYGGFDMGDVLVNTRTARYVRENMNPLGNVTRQAICYEAKKQVFFTYRSTSSTYNDQLLYIDMDAPGQSSSPKVAWWNHLQPNCLFLKRDINYVPRPWYGANDGFLYQMDQKNSDVNGVAYTMDIMTPSIDFAMVQQSPMTIPGQFTDINKLFDFLEIDMECSGKWYLNCDVFIDGKFSETILFTQSLLHGTDEFVGDIDRTYGTAPFSIRKKLHGSGKRIAFRFYSSGLDQNITLLRGQIYYRFGSQGEKDSS